VEVGLGAYEEISRFVWRVVGGEVGLVGAAWRSVAGRLRGVLAQRGKAVGTGAESLCSSPTRDDKTGTVGKAAGGKADLLKGDLRAEWQVVGGRVQQVQMVVL